MNEYLRKQKDILLETTKKALEANGMKVVILENKEEVIPYIDHILEKGEKVSVGGSQTLFEAGIIDYLMNRKDLIFYNRYEKDVNTREVFLRSFLTDYYFSSSNAITMDGYLYNVDNIGNRVAALIYGPQKVVIIAGENKIVRNKEEARQRVANIAGPANSMRLKMDNPCVKTGVCVNCHSKQRLCNIETIIGYQKDPERYTVILIKEDLGY